jgi:hypothetical protein
MSELGPNRSLAAECDGAALRSHSCRSADMMNRRADRSFQHEPSARVLSVDWRQPHAASSNHNVAPGLLSRRPQNRPDDKSYRWHTLINRLLTDRDISTANASTRLNAEWLAGYSPPDLPPTSGFRLEWRLGARCQRHCSFRIDTYNCRAALP